MANEDCDGHTEEELYVEDSEWKITQQATEQRFSHNPCVT